jgi:hypothetical protein
MSSSFPDYVALLGRFLEQHGQISEQIEQRLLNVQGKPITRVRDRGWFEQAFSGCFFDSAPSLASLKGRLAARHLADGFEPVLLEGRAHQLDPLELIVRAYDHWQRHRWPGRSGRLSHARTLFVVSMHFGHSIDWAVTIFDRVMNGLDAREARPSVANASARRPATDVPGCARGVFVLNRLECLEVVSKLPGAPRARPPERSGALGTPRA